MKHSIRQLKLSEKELIDSLFKKRESDLLAYTDLLIWWNKKINLVSRDVSRETVLMHIKHSLFISLSKGFLSSDYVLDTGSGGGLPGIPLSLCFPEKKFVINDIVTKKIFSVNDMINKLDLGNTATGLASDVGKLELQGTHTVVTKHAFKLDQLYRLIEKKNWDRLIFLKGYQEAINESKSFGNKLRMRIIKLDSDFMPAFYEGKGLVEIERISHE